MINKKLLLSVVVVLVAWALRADSASASTYYVRLDGGNSLQCTGTVDASYSGSGTGQPCAFNHPRYALGWGCTNLGNACANGGVMQGGDTLFIDGDDPTNGGAQAQYEIGYDDTNNNLTPGCSSFFPYDCTLGNLPAGINTSQRTSIIGTGNHKPQLWGTQRVWQVVNADNNHIWLQNLEITDHDSCAYNSPDAGCNYGGPYPYGQWGEDGLYLGGDDVNVTDVYIHGLGRYGINTDNFGSATFTRLGVIGNGFAGVSTGINATISGTLTFNQPIIEWNGCVESFPLSTTSPVDSPSNFSNCFGQNQNGYGDGLAFGNVGHGGAGNWTIYGPGSISFNTQDGLDTLHGTGTGVIQVDKMRFEGNAGNQVKMNALTSILTNSVVIGDCGWWLGSPQSSPGFAGGDICRALGDAVLFNVTNNSQTFLYNNTIVSNGNVALESEDLNGTGCNGSTSINAMNNIVYGGYTWIDDTSFNGAGGNSLVAYTYNDGNDGNGSGTCGSINWNEDYNIVNSTKNNNQGCSGSHDQCGVNPAFSNTIPMGTPGGGANTFYQGNAGETLVSLNSSSPAIASGFGGLTYWNNGNDYHNVTRTNPPSKGGLEANSCAANTYGCFFNSDCCGGEKCTNFVCGGTGSGAGNPTPPITTPPVSGAPVVVLTSPVNGSSSAASSDVTLTANASETNGNIAQVAFYYNGTNLIGTSATPPYEAIATNLPSGSVSLTAVATDINGATSTSSPITVTVAGPVQAVPIVTMTNPTSGTSVTAGSNITITVAASESNGTIAKVDFFSNGNLLGTDTTAPYTFILTNAPAGNYNLTAVATDANGATASSTPVTVTVTALVTPGGPTSGPSVIITSPSNNQTFTIPAGITITSSASESGGTISRVDYYAGSIYLGEATSSPYSVTWADTQAGTYNITAKATDSNGATFFSAPVNITVNPHTPPTVGLVTPVNNASFGTSANIVLTADATVTGGTLTKIDFYSGSMYLGTAYNSPYTITWSGAQPGNYSLTAKATDSYGWSTTSTAMNVTITSSTSNPPTVSIASPGGSASYTAPANISIVANASETNGSISRVDFYNGTNFIGSSSSSPYSFTLSNASAGNYSLMAVAIDANGVTAASSAVSVTVAAPVETTTPPVTTEPVTTTSSSGGSASVNISSPSNNASFTVPATISLTSNASESGGTISRVDYYAGSIYLGEATNSPYSVSWSSAQAGTYSLTARATDSNGAAFSSAPINITVNAHIPPTVTLTAPVNNASISGPANIVVTANASTGGGTITKVDFYNGTSYLGTSYASPYSINWNNVQPGTYSVTAKATDSYGWSTTSSAIAVNVTNGGNSLPTAPVTTAPSNPVTTTPPPSNPVVTTPPPSNPVVTTTPPPSNPVLPTTPPPPVDTTTVLTSSPTPPAPVNNGVLSNTPVKKAFNSSNPLLIAAEGGDSNNALNPLLVASEGDSTTNSDSDVLSSN